MAVERVKRLVAEALCRAASSKSLRPEDSSADATEGNASVPPKRENDPGYIPNASTFPLSTAATLGRHFCGDCLDDTHSSLRPV